MADANDPDLCPDCAGSGIGQGDPDTSRCRRCGGRGTVQSEADTADYWADLKHEERRERIAARREERRP